MLLLQLTTECILYEDNGGSQILLHFAPHNQLLMNVTKDHTYSISLRSPPLVSVCPVGTRMSCAHVWVC